MIAALRLQARELFRFGRLKTLSIVTVSHGFVALAFFLQMGLLARILSVAEFGKLATVMAIATVIEAAVNARGSETALAAFAGLRERDADARATITRRLLRLDLAWSSSIYAALMLGVLVNDRLRGTESAWLLILMLGGLAAFPWGTGKGYITVFLSARAFAPIEISYAATTLVLGVGLAWWLGGLGFALGLAAASVLRSVMGLSQLDLPWRSLFKRDARARDAEQRSLWWFGLTGTLRSALLNLVAQIDILLLAVVASPAAVGLYRAAKTLSGLTQRLAQPVWVILKRPIIAATSGDGDARSRRIVIRAAGMFAAVGLIVLPPALIYGGDVAALVFGARYREAGDLLWWLLPGAWAMFAITGWSALFGSISRRRLTVILLYLAQAAALVAATLLLGATMHAVAMSLALSQALVAAAFWGLFLIDGRDRDKTDAK